MVARIGLIMAITCLAMNSNASSDVLDCKASSGELAALVGTKLVDFSLQVTPETLEIVDTSLGAGRNEDPSDDVPRDFYTITGAESCYSFKHAAFPADFLVLEGTRGKSYRVSTGRVINFINVVSKSETKKIDFRLKDFASKYSTAEVARFAIVKQAEAFCNQYGRSTLIVKPARIAVKKAKHMLFDDFAPLSLEWYGLQWYRHVMVDFTCR